MIGLQVIDDKLNEFAELLSSLIEKYVEKIDLSELPEPTQKRGYSEELQTA